MNSVAAIPAMETSRKGRPNWILLLVLLLLGVFAISSQSFWIDEATTGIIARQRSLRDWWQALVADHGSNTQMPFYMIYVWAWEKLAGTGEWAMRLSNLPWLALGLGVFFYRPKFFLITIGFSPFLWFYMNELRPYAMQVAATLVMAACLWRLAELPPNADKNSEERWCVAGFCLALLAMSGCSLLGMIWSAAVLGCAWFVLGWRRLFDLLRRHIVLTVSTTIVLCGLAAFYLWSMKQGARASAGKTDLTNIGFVGYEVMGLSGLGPGRLEIRGSRVGAFLPFAVPLGIHAALAVFALFAGVRFAIAKLPVRIWLGSTICVAATTGLLFVAGYVTHFRVLGRHFAPLAACLMLLTACGLWALWNRGGWRRVCVGFFLLASLASAVSLRVASRHAKDDFRDAVALAGSALQQNERVWWCADGMGARFYGLPTDNQAARPDAGRAWLIRNPVLTTLSSQPPPDLVVVSKPDLYDAAGGTQEYLARNHYQVWRKLAAFTLWRRAQE